MKKDNSKDNVSTPASKNIKLLTKYFEDGCKKPGHESIGVEIEHFVVTKQNDSLVNYFGDKGINVLLKEIAPHFDEMSFSTSDQDSKKYILALRTKDCYISLEPGAQLEMSLGTFTKIKDFLSIYNKMRSIIDPVLDLYGYKLVTKGYRPQGLVQHVELIPSLRYDMMCSYFKKLGGTGIKMMCQTAATQVSIDYNSEADFIKKFRLANILTPIFAFITDNASIYENQDGHNMIRTMIWNSVDSDRSLFAHNALDKDNFGFVDYAEYVYNRPPIMIPFKDSLFFTDKALTKDIYSDKILTSHEIQHLLSIFFPFVRLKNYIEIRMADSMPIEHVLGFIALIKGLFYNKATLNELLQLFSSVDSEMAFNAFEALKNHGINSTIYGMKLKDLLSKFVSTASANLPLDEKLFLHEFANAQIANKYNFDLDFATIAI
ncbi:MAG: hypothetical protein LBF12_06845 [Christensenellaceae bacterium]|jgi:glutamate--cysteine ligase|nr:hypothetical protein [Christensenellaceae bacterium]